MKYEKEIDQIFELLFRENDMDDTQYTNFLVKVLDSTGITKEELSETIEAGVQNGYGVDVQIDLIKQTFQTLKLNPEAI